jgi:hypothetical protein
MPVHARMLALVAIATLLAVSGVMLLLVAGQ